MFRKIILYLQVALYTSAGINHFWHPSFYLKLIPPYLPFPHFINSMAGIVEILLSWMLAYPITRKVAAYGIVLLLFAFILSHVYFLQSNPCYQNGNCESFLIGWVRLFIVHPFLLAWAWMFTKDHASKKSVELQVANKLRSFYGGSYS